MVKTAMTAVKDGRDKLMDAIFGVREAGACVSPDYWCGCYQVWGYNCCHFNCVGDWLCYPTDPPPGHWCPGPRG